jgi:hypothetical protein
MAVRVREVRAQEATRVRCLHLHDLFGRSGGDDAPALVAALRAEVVDVSATGEP